MLELLLLVTELLLVAGLLETLAPPLVSLPDDPEQPSKVEVNDTTPIKKTFLIDILSVPSQFIWFRSKGLGSPSAISYGDA